MSTTAELLATGLSPGQIRRLVRDGALRPVLTGVYASAGFTSFLTSESTPTRGRRRAPGSGPGRLGEPAADHLLKVAAVLAATGSRSVGSHHSAAQVHGLSLIRGTTADLVHLTRSAGDRGSRTGRPGIRVHQAALPAEHVVLHRGVPVTSVGRTVVDLARALPFAEGVAAELWAAFRRGGGAAGADPPGAPAHPGRAVS